VKAVASAVPSAAVIPGASRPASDSPAWSCRLPAFVAVEVINHPADADLAFRSVAEGSERPLVHRTVIGGNGVVDAVEPDQVVRSTAKIARRGRFAADEETPAWARIAGPASSTLAAGREVRPRVTM